MDSRESDEPEDAAFRWHGGRVLLEVKLSPDDLVLIGRWAGQPDGEPATRREAILYLERAVDRSLERRRDFHEDAE